MLGAHPLALHEFIVMVISGQKSYVRFKGQAMLSTLHSQATLWKGVVISGRDSGGIC